MSDPANALIENIQKKGENSYYYAHAPRNIDSFEEAKVVTGDGIVTGGPPVLIKRHDSVTESSPFAIIRNYSWADGDGKVTVYVPFEEDVEESQVRCEFESKSFCLTYMKNEADVKKLVIKKLYKEIDPNNSRFRIRTNKVVIHLTKLVSGSWYKLVDN